MCPAVPMTIDFMPADVSSGPGLGSFPFALAGPLAAGAGFGPRVVLGFRAARPGPAIALRCANPLEKLDEPQVDLTPFHVHLDDLHADLVAEPKRPPGVLST